MHEKQWSFLTSADLFEIFESSFPPSLPSFLPSFSFFILSYSPSFISSFYPGHTEISKHPIECRDTVQVNNGDSDSKQTTILLSELFQFCVFYKVIKYLWRIKLSYNKVVLALSKFKNIVFQFQVFSQMYFLKLYTLLL